MWRCEPVDVTGSGGSPVGDVTIFGSLEGTADNFIELSDEGPLTKYAVVVLCLNQPAVVLGPSVDP